MFFGPNLKCLTLERWRDRREKERERKQMVQTSLSLVSYFPLSGHLSHCEDKCSVKPTGTVLARVNKPDKQLSAVGKVKKKTTRPSLGLGFSHFSRSFLPSYALFIKIYRNCISKNNKNKTPIHFLHPDLTFNLVFIRSPIKLTILTIGGIFSYLFVIGFLWWDPVLCLFPSPPIWSGPSISYFSLLPFPFFYKFLLVAMDLAAAV